MISEMTLFLTRNSAVTVIADRTAYMTHMYKLYGILANYQTGYNSVLISKFPL